jgi:two-component system, OmpR family, sensor kinase
MAEVMLKQPQQSEREYRDALALMDAQTRRLTRIVEEMFTLARAAAGRRPLEMAEFYLDELLAETVQAAAVLGARKGVNVTMLPAPETPFRGDESLLRQMLLNLLDNAIKHTPPVGAVQISLNPQLQGLEIAVTDTGTGIPAEAQSHIFERFYRVDRARSRSEAGAGSGAGLGLSIARWIAEAHAGKLELRNSDRTGTTFTVVLPLP